MDKKVNSIGFRIILLLSPTLLVIFLSIILINNATVKNELLSAQKTELNSQVSDLASLIDNVIENQKLTVELISENESIISYIVNDDKKSVIDLLNIDLTKVQLAEALHILTPDGIIWADTEEDGIGMDLSETDLYINLKNNPDKIYISNSYVISPITGNIVIPAGKAILHNGKAVGYFVFSMNFTAVSNKYINPRKYGKTGYAFMADENGILISHPEKAALLSDQSHDGGAIEKILKDKKDSDFFGYTFKGKNKYLSFKHLENVPWNIIVSIYEDDLLHTAFTLMRNMAVISIISMLLIFLNIVLIIRNSVLKRVKVLENNLLTAANGDISNRVSIKRKDEIASIYKSLNTMFDNFTDFLDNVNSRILEVNSSGEAMDQSIADVSTAVVQIESNINMIKKQILEQTSSTNQTAASVEELARNIETLNTGIVDQSASITQSSAAIEEMAANIDSISKTIESGTKNVSKMTTASEQGQSSIEAVGEVIQKIVSESEELMQANELIANLSSQTNLLSMNAAIEAAHAGDAGKGFAVVSDEIRKLAEESGSQSKVVNTNLSNIKQSIDSLIVAAKQNSDGFNAMDSSIKDVSEIFTTVNESMNELNIGSKQVLEGLNNMQRISSEVTSGAEEMKAGNGQIVSAVSHLQDVSRITQEAIEEITIGMNEITKSITEEESLSKDNVDKIAKITEEASKFKTH
ncbi:MAG: cache domain-containing protein [Spirochaetales bacterium]|nr:cache domain-containing protein [Spirochaetales bacterium]